MNELTEKIKINILESLIQEVERDHPEYQEENTTGWDMIQSGKEMLEELKEKYRASNSGKCDCDFPKFTWDSPMKCENCGGSDC